MLTRKFGRTKGAVAVSVIALSAVAGSGWAIGNAANAATDNPTPDSAAPGNAVTELCPDGKVPMLDIEKFPDSRVVGAQSAAAALAAETTSSAAGAATFVPFGTGSKDPVWVTTDSSSYIVTPTPDGGWFASPATLQGCNSLDEIKGLAGT